ncbi:MAG: ferritin-like domain-containing protein [Ginsengibacter sp.]
MLTHKTSGKAMPVNEGNIQHVSRRKFLGYVGAASALLATSASCKKNDNNINDTGQDLGSGDVGILNYAYALEQLEAAFYVKVAQSPYAGITAQETSYLTDIRDHEVAHREFFKAALGADAIPALEVNFSAINFGDRMSVLTTARAFEDLGVSAYNGAGKLISNTTTGLVYLTLAGKIVSVEARHAALIRDLIAPGSFADPLTASNGVINPMGLDLQRSPADVLAIAGAYISTKINASNLPTS